MKKKIPTSSYRLQLSSSFDFKAAVKILPYLKKLGIEMVYTTPYFKVVYGSSNPYMVITPLEISDELGGETAFLEFASKCKELSLQHMMDIVPNHMAANEENAYWEDVVMNGQESDFASYFDIDWEGGDGRIILPGIPDINAKINYRRFFDICDMVGINMENSDLYDLYFSKIREYVDRGFIQGFRVDHIDGLKYPKQFLEQMHADFPDQYVALEKIVQADEMICKGWKCDGSVGYDILFLLDQVMLDKGGEKIFTELFNEYSDEKEIDLPKIKKNYLNHYLISEMHRFSKWFGVESEELLDFLSHFPVYRTYLDEDDLCKFDREAIEHAASFTKGTFFKTEVFKSEHKETFIKLQQILPAVFAKGFEDTFNYRYMPLASLNEVGGDPKTFSISNERFHKRLIAIHKAYPNTMHTLSTHDTKRSLDARMRLHTLAEMPARFKENLEIWMGILPPFESGFIKYLFIQSLIAISEVDLEKRLTEYMVKAVREGKYYSDHLVPDIEFEEKMTNWILLALKNKEFAESFYPFKQEVAKAAMMKSVSMLVLQGGLFGVMDIYQGEELVEANLVDPDNRRPIDFERRLKALDDGSSLKMKVLHALLQFRQEHHDLILKGSYEAVATEDSCVGYIRRYEDKELLVLVNKFHSKGEVSESLSVEDRESIFSEEYPFYFSITQLPR